MLDPRTGNQCDETGSVVLSYEAFKAKIAARTQEYDEEAARMVDTVHVPGWSAPFRVNRDFGDEG